MAERIFSSHTPKALSLSFCLSVIGASFFGTVSASAQSSTRNCGPRDMVVERLAAGYGETRQSMGLGADSSVIEVFASPETGTWTITVTTPNGTTCLVASGQAFEELAEALPAPGDDA